MLPHLSINGRKSLFNDPAHLTSQTSWPTSDLTNFESRNTHVDQRDVALLHDASRRMSLEASTEVESYMAIPPPTGTSGSSCGNPRPRATSAATTSLMSENMSTRLDTPSFSPSSMLSAQGLTSSADFLNDVSYSENVRNRQDERDGTNGLQQCQLGDPGPIYKQQSMDCSSDFSCTPERRCSMNSSASVGWNGKENVKPQPAKQEGHNRQIGCAGADATTPTVSNSNKCDMVMSSVLNFHQSAGDDPTRSSLAFDFAVKYQRMLSNLIDAMTRSEKTRSEVNKLRPAINAVCEAVQHRKRRASVPPCYSKSTKALRKSSPMKHRLSNVRSSS